MYSAKRGWYRLLNPDRFAKPLDEHMQSFKDGHVQFKSNLERKAFRYCDYNVMIKTWSVEPFAIKYLSPKDGKIHRYYVDLFIEFEGGHKFLVEIKSYGETVPPKKPRRITTKSVHGYEQACLTYSVNQAKWNAAKQFAGEHGMQFTLLTEKELG